MPLISPSGLSIPQSPLAGAETPVTVVDVLKDAPIVKNPAVEQMAVDTSQYANMAKALVGYIEGSRQTVTYFQQTRGDNDRRMNIVDTPTNRAVIHTSYLRINNMEITLSEPWSFSQDPSTTQSLVTGKAVTYPQFVPAAGDLFIAPAGDGALGYFRVSSVEITSFRSERCYQITFVLTKFAEQVDLDFLTAATTKTMNFYKPAFLGERATLLTQDTVTYLQVLKNMQTVLARFYYQTFFDRGKGSVIGPDGVYDPYLVKFVTSLIPHDVAPIRPRQLLATADAFYERTIWARLQSPLNLAISDLWSYWAVRKREGRATDAGLTTLVNNQYVVIGAGPSDVSPDMVQGYILSANFYQENLAAMTPFEALVHQMATMRTTDPVAFITTYLNTYLSLTPQQQYIQIPFYLFIIRQIIPQMYSPW